MHPSFTKCTLFYPFFRLRRPFIRRGSPSGAANGPDGWKGVRSRRIAKRHPTPLLPTGFVVPIPEGLIFLNRISSLSPTDSPEEPFLDVVLAFQGPP
jgi:hypothetical protein